MSAMLGIKGALFSGSHNDLDLDFLWLYQCQRLISICDPAKEVTYYSFNKENTYVVHSSYLSLLSFRVYKFLK